MASKPLVDVARFQRWIGQTIAGTERQRVEEYLAAASGLIRSTAGQTWLDESGALTAVPDEIEAVVLAVTERKWNNPTGVVHETAGPFSARWAEDAGQGLYLTDTERDMVERYRPTSGLGTIDITRGDLETTTYIDVAGSTKPLPLGELS